MIQIDDEHDVVAKTNKAELNKQRKFRDSVQTNKSKTNIFFFLPSSAMHCRHFDDKSEQIVDECVDGFVREHAPRLKINTKIIICNNNKVK